MMRTVDIDHAFDVAIAIAYAAPSDSTDLIEDVLMRAADEIMPLHDCNDVKAAVRLAKKVHPAFMQAVHNHIIGRAHALGCHELIPGYWRLD